MGFEVVESSPDVIKIVLGGRIDFANAQSIDAPLSLAAVERRGMVIDLSRVEFMASMGLRILIKCAKIMNGRHGKLALLSPRPMVAEVLQMSGVAELIPVFDSEVTAIASVTPG